MILAMAVFFGGLAQMIVATLAFRRGETFAGTVFGRFAFLGSLSAPRVLSGVLVLTPTARRST